jgi:hypothetical protein
MNFLPLYQHFTAKTLQFKALARRFPLGSAHKAGLVAGVLGR